MPPTFLRGGSAVQTAPVSSPIALSITVNAGEYVVCSINDAENSALTVTSITGGGGTPAQRVARSHTNTGTQRTQIWSYLATAGASSVSVAFTGTPLAAELSVAIYSDVSGLGPNTGANDCGASSTVADPNTNITTTSPTSRVVGAAVNWANNAMTAKNGSSVRSDTGGTGATDIRGGIFDNTYGTVGSNNIAVTEAAGEWAAVAIELLSGGLVDPGIRGTRGLPFKGPRDARGFLKQRVWSTDIPASNPITAATDTGQLALTGFAPTVSVSNNIAVAPGVGQLTLAGFAPTVTTTNNVAVATGVGALILSGFAPAVTASDHKIVTPGVGALTLSGFAPAINIGVNVFPGAGALSLSGFAPTITATQNQTVTPGVGALTLSGFAPTASVSNNKVVTPGVGALALSGFAPTIVKGTVAYPGAGLLSLSGFAPTVAATANKVVTPGTGLLTLAGFAPVASIGIRVTPGVGQLLLQGFAPSIFTASAMPPIVIPAVAWFTPDGVGSSFVADAHGATFQTDDGGATFTPDSG